MSGRQLKCRTLTSAWIEKPMACRTRPPRLVALSRVRGLKHVPIVNPVSYTHLACADDPSLSVEERQLILLSMVHPLWVRLEEVLYREAHTPESEDAFNLSLIHI